MSQKNSRKLDAVITEKAVSANIASKTGIALYIEKGGVDGNTYTLWDVLATINVIKSVKRPSLKFLKQTLENTTMMAMISIDPNITGNWNASEIEATAAEKGYGPLLYDIAMTFEKGLVPDRLKVSDAAKSLWQFYFDNRKDVIHKPLDDKYNPKTKPKIDDSENIYPGEEENPLNYAYFMKRAPETSKLLLNNRNGIKALASIMNVDQERIKDMIVNATHDFFERKYKR